MTLISLSRSSRIALLGLSLLFLCGSTWQYQATLPGQANRIMLPGQGCTVFYGVDGNVVLGGNNEDFINPLTFVWFIPAQKGRFGMVVFGYDELTPQGIVNDQGLFYDGLALPFKAFRDSARPAPPNGLINLLEEVFATSSTVEQAQELLSRYDLNGLQTGQLFFGDRFGHSLIIDGDTVLPIQGKFQVATNFRQVDFPAPPFSDPRFNTATQMLTENDAYSVDLFRRILETTHQEGATPTQYSQVYDLKNGIIYLYHFHNYQDVVVININEELAKGAHSFSISSLFPKNQAREEFAFQALLQYQVNFESRANKNFNAEKLADYVGEYHNPAAPGEPSTQVYVESGKLLVQKTGLPFAQFLPVNDDAFFHAYFLAGVESQLNFTRDILGQVIGLDEKFMMRDFNIVQTYHLEKKKNDSSQILWIIFAIGLGGSAVIGCLIWFRKRRHLAIIQ